MHIYLILFTYLDMYSYLTVYLSVYRQVTTKFKSKRYKIFTYLYTECSVILQNMNKGLVEFEDAVVSVHEDAVDVKLKCF